jgi:hypothetical protein
MSEDNVKIIVVGPSQVGKSCLANCLGGTRDTPTVEYKETCPLRILETDVSGLSLTGGRRIGRGSSASVEVWDVGGATRFQSCWPAIKQGADAVIFVMNPEVQDQERELEFWHKNFAGDKIPAHLCVVFAHHSTPPQGGPLPRMPNALGQIKVYETSLDFQSDNFKDVFERLVESVLIHRREVEESAALKNDVMSGAVTFGVTQ